MVVENDRNFTAQIIHKAPLKIDTNQHMPHPTPVAWLPTQIERQRNDQRIPRDPKNTRYLRHTEQAHNKPIVYHW